MATEYATARPRYPDAVFETLEAEGVIGPGTRVLEIGAGAGLATRGALAAAATWSLSNPASNWLGCSLTPPPART